MSDVTFNFITKEDDFSTMFNKKAVSAFEVSSKEDSDKIFNSHSTNALFCSLVDMVSEIKELMSLEEVDDVVAKDALKQLLKQVSSIKLLQKASGISMNAEVLHDASLCQSFLENLLSGKVKSGKKNKKEKAAQVMANFFNPLKAKAPEVIEASSVVVPSVDGIELSEDDIIAVKLARLRRPLSQHLREVVTTGIPFIPSEIHIAGADYVALCEEYGFDGEDFLIHSIIPGCVSMIMMMNDRAPVETVQSMVEQLDSARDAWLASQIRNLQEKAEEPEVIAGETEQARQANKTARPRSAKK